ncbi:shTK domain protein [Ancylostoma caninum]|uniref:ShTK domain protein n=1 Tax=Ancylostoma caninum TaxID=29170 RepID=A0A368GAF8_ANCCA|nr:shTK domain protein [Ancylostoma caninum]
MKHSFRMWIFLASFVAVSFAAAPTPTTTPVANATDSGAATTASSNTTTNCSDAIPDCSKYSRLCDKPEYRSVMVQQCAQYCKLCDVTCVDRSQNCAFWDKFGFCSSRFYSDKLKAYNCASTCKMCPNSTQLG